MKNDLNFNVKKERPEDLHPNVSDYYNKETLTKYATSKSMMRIQEKITKRAVRLLELKNPNPLILDAGSGPGFASIYLTDLGFRTVALDIIPEFLYFYDIKNLNPILSDMCYPPFKANSFDAIISISALQWIFRDLKNKKMHFLLVNLARSFYNILKKKSKAVFQFYPKNNTIMEKIGDIIIKSTPFEGEIVIDNPYNPKKRKIFLVVKKK